MDDMDEDDMDEDDMDEDDMDELLEARDLYLAGVHEAGGEPECLDCPAHGAGDILCWGCEADSL